MVDEKDGYTKLAEESQNLYDIIRGEMGSRDGHNPSYIEDLQKDLKKVNKKLETGGYHKRDGNNTKPSKGR